MDEKMMRERIRSLEEHTDKLVAQKDALMAKLDAWEKTGKAIMLCAVGREAPLSDSDVCGEINALRQQVAELENALSKRAEQQARMWEIFRGMASAYHEIRSNTDLRFNYYMTQLDKLRD